VQQAALQRGSQTRTTTTKLGRTATRVSAGPSKSSPKRTTLRESVAAAQRRRREQVDASRRRRNADKSAGLSLSTAKTKQKKHRPARKVSPQDALDRKKKRGSERLNDRNYKGYDATKGNPRRRNKLRHCKERPDPNREPERDENKKGGGSGGGKPSTKKDKDFVPWCK